jgi:hypothetical protein
LKNRQALFEKIYGVPTGSPFRRCGEKFRGFGSLHLGNFKTESVGVGKSAQPLGDVEKNFLPLRCEWGMRETRGQIKVGAAIAFCRRDGRQPRN